MPAAVAGRPIAAMNFSVGPLTALPATKGLTATTGTPVKAAQGGRVIHAGWEGAYGNSVVLDHGNGLQTRYAHLSKISVSVGGQISQGAQVGLSGATGQVTGPHLHFEVIRNGTRVNPAGYIPL